MKGLRMCKRMLAAGLLLAIVMFFPGCGGKNQGDVLGLMYHHLVEDPAQATAWITTPDELRNNLTDLQALGYRPLSLEDYAAENYDPMGDYFIVTFDDGYLSNLTLAGPVLEEMGIPAAIFVITGCVGTPEYMTWEDLRTARDGGVFTLYSHTHSHKSAPDMTTEEFLADAAVAWDELTTHLGEGEHKILSYPNGAYTKKSMKALRAAGYDMLVIQEKPKWFREKHHGRLLLRVNVPGRGADIKEIANYHRTRCGVRKIQ